MVGIYFAPSLYDALYACFVARVYSINVDGTLRTYQAMQTICFVRFIVGNCASILF